MDFIILFAIFILLGLSIFHCIYYGLGDFVLEAFVNPSFDYKFIRLARLCLASLSAHLLFCWNADFLTDHFHIPSFDVAKLPLTSAFITSVVYFATRLIVKRESPRVAREHLSILMFVLSISTIASIVPHKNHAGSFVFIPEIPIGISGFAIFILLSLTLPFLGEAIFYFDSYFFRAKESKLIDLTAELPIKLKFISGKKKIDKKIADLIRDDLNSELRILTNGYTTVEDNQQIILDRLKKADVKIIGGDFSRNQKIANRVDCLTKAGINMCEGHFDEIRVIIDGHQRLLASFATGGKGSHIGVFSEHPFIIALFKAYFDTKCCILDCKERGLGLNLANLFFDQS